MSFTIHSRETEGITILDMGGRLIVGSESTRLREYVEGLIEQGSTRFIADLHRVDFIDSTGLGVLVLAHSQAEKAGGAMKLLHISRRSAQLLVLTKLSTVFSIYDDEQAAINSFFPDRETRHFDILEFVKSQNGAKDAE